MRNWKVGKITITSWEMMLREYAEEDCVDINPIIRPEEEVVAKKTPVKISPLLIADTRDPQYFMRKHYLHLGGMPCDRPHKYRSDHEYILAGHYKVEEKDLILAAGSAREGGLPGQSG